MQDIVVIKDVRKSYADGFEALKGISLSIKEGEILALLGPNGAGKTTLISAICGIARLASGSVTVGGFDIVSEYRQARSLIGLVPQEIALDPFARVMHAVRFTRGVFGKQKNDAYLEDLLKKLSLWDKRSSQLNTLSGGMRRRVMIAKALSHEPRILFLDEPTAGVDVELRRDMWKIVAALKATGVTIILTTHFIEEAEAMADRVGVIMNGRLLLVQEKNQLMQQMGQKELEIQLNEPIATIPAVLTEYDLELINNGGSLIYRYDRNRTRKGIRKLLTDIGSAGLVMQDLRTRQSSLEDIFVDLIAAAEARDVA